MSVYTNVERPVRVIPTTALPGPAGAFEQKVTVLNLRFKAQIPEMFHGLI